jgi:hypothetical protein
MLASPVYVVSQPIEVQFEPFVSSQSVGKRQRRVDQGSKRIILTIPFSRAFHRSSNFLSSITMTSTEKAELGTNILTHTFSHTLREALEPLRLGGAVGEDDWISSPVPT